MNAQRLKSICTDSRWAWFAKGLPSVTRARALFLARDFTMTTPQRCKKLWDLCHGTLRRGVPGAFVECGVWRGGSAGIMGLAMKSDGQNRELHLFDSFEGLPEPGLEDGPKAAEYSGHRDGGKLVPISRCDVNVQAVEKYLFGKLRLDRQNVHSHIGWFQDTVPIQSKRIGPIAVLRLDGDWYASTRVCLEHLYPLLSPGGVLILDDYYCWEGCKKATDEYRLKEGISTPMVQVDADCGYWVNC